MASFRVIDSGTSNYERARMGIRKEQHLWAKTSITRVSNMYVTDERIMTGALANRW